MCIRDRGVGTILADDPELTCRALARNADSPAVFVLDSQLRTPPNARIFGAGSRPVTLLYASSAPKDRLMLLKQAGAVVTRLPAHPNGQLDLDAVLDHLGAGGINTLLVEAGTGVTTAMLVAGLVDKIYWTQSPHILGADVRPVVGPLKLLALPNQNIYTQLTSSQIGQDQLRVFVQNINADLTG